MSEYTDNCKIRFFLQANDKYTTDKFLYWKCGRKNSDWEISISPEFESDTSIPPLLQWLFDKHDVRYLKAARVHDYLLEHGYDPAFAAAEFYNALLADGVGSFEAYVMYQGVFHKTVVFAKG